MDVRSTAPVLAQAVRRSPRVLRKRGPRSFCARQRRYGKFVSLKNSLHGFSSTSTVSPSSVVSPTVSTNVCVERVSSTSVLEAEVEFLCSFSVYMSTFEAGVLMLTN